MLQRLNNKNPSLPHNSWANLSGFSSTTDVYNTDTHTNTHTAGIKTSWQGQGPGFLDNLNQTNCFNASILCHYERPSLSADGFRARRMCASLCVCVLRGVADCWAPQTTWQILFCSGKLARLCQHWGSSDEEIFRLKESQAFKKLLNVQDIRAAVGGLVSFLLTHWSLWKCMLETEECDSIRVCVCGSL